MVVVEVLADGIADGPAPGVGAESVGVFVLGKMNGLGESLWFGREFARDRRGCGRSEA